MDTKTTLGIGALATLGILYYLHQHYPNNQYVQKVGRQVPRNVYMENQILRNENARLHQMNADSQYGGQSARMHAMAKNLSEAKTTADHSHNANKVFALGFMGEPPKFYPAGAPNSLASYTDILRRRQHFGAMPSSPAVYERQRRYGAMPYRATERYAGSVEATELARQKYFGQMTDTKVGKSEAQKVFGMK